MNRFGAAAGVTALFVLLAGCAFLVQAVAAANGDPTIEGVLACFAATLVASHAWFLAARNRHGPSLPKYIDYVYLAVGSLGLLLSSAESMEKGYRDEVERFMRDRAAPFFRSVDEVGWSVVRRDCPDVAASPAGGPGPEGPPVEAIATLPPRICPGFRYDLDVLETYLPAIEDLSSVADLGRPEAIWARMRAGLSNPKLDRVAREFEASADALLRRRPFLSGRPTWELRMMSDMPSGLGAFRQLGFYLLSAAAALRIAKVTVELRKWHS